MTDAREAAPRGRVIRTLIVDDDPLARERIRALLAEDSEVDVVGECGDGEKAVSLVREAHPDLMFLDVEMPRRDGFEVLRELEDGSLPFVVFVTAYDMYAVRAFDVHAVDYLLKPFDDARFRAALDRAKTEAAHRRDTEFASRVAEMLKFREGLIANGAAAPSREGASAADDQLARQDPEAGYLRRFVVRRSGRIQFIAAESVDWFEAADYYVRLHVGGDSHLVRTTMRRLEAELDPARFIRIHRSTIVRIDFIRELQPYFRGEYVVLLEDGTRRSLSRSRRKRLERALGQRL